MTTTDTSDLRPLSDEQIAANLAPAEDAPASKPRRRSGTSGAERARRAKSGTDKPASKPGSRSTTTRRAPLAPRVENAHAVIGLGLSFAPIGPAGPAVGMALVEHAGPIGQAWEQLAKENPRVRETLEKLLTVSAVGSLLAAYLPVIMAGLAASGKAPALGGLGGLGAMMTDVPGPAVVFDVPAQTDSEQTAGA